MNQALTETFSLTPAQAYEKFAPRTMRVDEFVEAYASDLKRLLNLSGLTVSSSNYDRILIKQFLPGLNIMLQDFCHAT